MVKHNRVASIAGAILVSSLLLTGCSTTEAPVNQGNERPSTNFREKGNTNKNESGTYVDHTDTSRQDGVKNIRYTSPRVAGVNETTGKKLTEDKETLFTVEVLSIDLKGTSTMGVKAVEKDSRGALQLVDSTEEVDIYAISLEMKFTSGWDDPTQPKFPIFWGIDSGGLVSYAIGTSATTVKAGDQKLSFDVAVPKGAPAPIGVRYMLFNDVGKKLLSPTADAFLKQAQVKYEEQGQKEEEAPESEAEKATAPDSTKDSETSKP